MCGRYDLHTIPGAMALALGVDEPDGFVARYNIAPGQRMLALRVAPGGEREWAMVRWGLVPRWARDAAIGNRMVNARAETMATSRAFATPFARHRCLIPADGWYAWQAQADGSTQPVRATHKEGRPLAFAGMAERWLSPTGEVLDSGAIITTAANTLLRDVHPRMPVIVQPADYARWLDTTAELPFDLLAAFPGRALTVYAVSPRVDSKRNDDAALIEPVANTALELLMDRVVDTTDDDTASSAPAQAQLF